jgi:hypothetical protein
MATPSALSLFARLVLRGKDREFMLGDLDELYERRRNERGSWAASALYLRDVMFSIPGGTHDSSTDPKRTLGRLRASWGSDLGNDLRSAFARCVAAPASPPSPS